MSVIITASAPGSLMLLGEHAVLHGRRALVAAVSQRLRVTLHPRRDDEIHVSSALGSFVTSRSNVEINPPLRFALSVIAERSGSLPSGFDLEIDSDFSDQIGFGSSAAVTVATAAALQHWVAGHVDQEALFQTAVAVIRNVQGLGSGADVAASVFGGIVAYRADPLDIVRLDKRHALTAVYSGSKKPTVEVVRFVEERRAMYPQMFDNMFDLIDQGTASAVEAVRNGRWSELGAIMNFCHGLMDAMGVSNHVLSAIVYALRADPGILGSKISGSGLGDCAIGLGMVRNNDFPHDVIPVEISREGVLVEAD
jgi:mevalonate kinase